ncbi:MAG: Cof subfamily protein (haloacid dehalogenase superfamily) [Planctomycetota bacterium]|jgi:Cof subfamily protein (haloacid dehalogenase superfamily)
MIAPVQKDDGQTYDAILLDLDGTLVNSQGSILPRTRSALHAASEAGIRVMIATGRSAEGTLPVIEALGLDGPAVVYNGAGIYCPRAGKLIEERVLSNRAVERTLAFASERELLTVVMRPRQKFGMAPRTDEERAATKWLEELKIVPAQDLPRETLIRITLFGLEGMTSARLRSDLEASMDQPVYLTDFPLNCLAGHRESLLGVVDIQPPCRGKGEALRFLQETYGIPPERVVAVGDASNDVPMLEAAGLGVVMEESMVEAREVADRTIGSCETDTIAELVEELFLS